MTVIELKQKLTRQLEQMEPNQLALIDVFFDALTNNFGSQKGTEVDRQNTPTSKKELVSTLRGMAASSTLSSDDFARRKQEEIDWEDPNL